MNEKQIETIKAYKEAIKHVKSMTAETTDEKLARDYAIYYYMSKEIYCWLYYHKSEEYKKEMKEENAFHDEEIFGKFEDEEIEKDIEWTIKGDEANHEKCKTLRDYLYNVADEKLIDKYMEKYGWI